MLIPELSAPRRPALNGHWGKTTRRDWDGLFPRLSHPSWRPLNLRGADQPPRVTVNALRGHPEPLQLN